MNNLNSLFKAWPTPIIEEINKDYFLNILKKIHEQSLAGTPILPADNQIFNAFEACHFKDIKVVILGQDPYHGAGEANGLSFSVNKGVKIPPSLRNIFKELQADINGFTIPANGDLSKWAQQGVLLLNSSLTVIENQAGSHSHIGWQLFTDEIIRAISDYKENVAFILWGAHAQSKKHLIHSSKHCILESAHPSPLSAYRGFFNSKPFSKTNAYLSSKGKLPIDWQL